MGGLAATAIFSLCLLCGVDAQQQPVVAAPTQDGWPDIVATRQTVFFIPFGVSDVGNPPKGDSQEDLAAAVQLWVSADQGRTWRLADSVTARRRGFLFRAEHDGEFCFIARMNGQDQGPPDHRTVPGLRVLVDTQPPTLHLQAWRGDAGQVCSQWMVDEPFVKPGSFQIFCRSGRQTSQQRSQWQEIAIDRRLIDGRLIDGRVIDGRVIAERRRSGRRPATVNWCADADADFVEIRAKVVDLAGNTSISHAYVDMAR